jgi:hypothetical protein
VHTEDIEILPMLKVDSGTLNALAWGKLQLSASKVAIVSKPHPSMYSFLAKLMELLACSRTTKTVSQRIAE